MSELTVSLNGTRLGRSALDLKTQEYLRLMETDVKRLESQLWQLVELRSHLKARCCDQWRATIGRMEAEARVKLGLTVEIETPSWVLLMGGNNPTVQASAQNERTR